MEANRGNRRCQGMLGDSPKGIGLGVVRGNFTPDCFAEGAIQAIPAAAIVSAIPLSRELTG